MFAKPDLLLDAYRPLLRAAFSSADILRKVPVFERVFRQLRRAAARSPAAASTGRLAGAETAADAPVSLDSTLEEIIGPRGCPGMAALALRGERIVAQGVAGWRKKGSPERITLADRFHLGSCGKAMTATLAAILVEEGKLNWTTTLAELFGDVVKGLHPAWKSVTLQQVLAHRGGLPRDAGIRLRTQLISSSLTLSQQRLEVVTAELSRPPKYRPGAKLVYSNDGYMLVGAALEKITGLDWPNLIQERLFRPLGITTAGFGVPGTAGRVDQPWGHVPFLGTPIDPGKPFAEAPLFHTPAGLQHMAITDWVKFVALHLRGDIANPHRCATLLRPETFEKLHPSGKAGDYEAGWMLENREWANGTQPGATGRVLLHSGSNFRWFCYVWMAPEINFAVLTACNRGMDLAAWKVCHRAAGTLIRAFASKSPTAP